jgi:hypothetical protein
VLSTPHSTTTRWIRELVISRAAVTTLVSGAAEATHRLIASATVCSASGSDSGLLVASTHRRTPVGRYFLRNVAMALDGYLPKQQAGTQARFRRTV